MTAQYNLFFRDPDWLQMNQLNHMTVLDYFSLSSFYDKTCCNEICKVQRIQCNNDTLLNMKGIQYTILEYKLSPNLILIEKLERESPDKYNHLGYYYVLGGNIYQAPDLYSLINTRLNKITEYMNKAYEDISQYHEYNENIGSYWLFKEKEMDEKEEYPVEKVEEDIVRNERKVKLNQLEWAINQTFNDKIMIQEQQQQDTNKEIGSNKKMKIA